jgi:hypothetical protein
MEPAVTIDIGILTLQNGRRRSGLKGYTLAPATAKNAMKLDGCMCALAPSIGTRERECVFPALDVTASKY